MKKGILLILILSYMISFSSYIYCDVYPVPANMSVTKGDSLSPDVINISWEAPIPPSYGEGFEAGQMPPPNWDIINNNTGLNTWHINDQTDYLHSGSYSAICNYLPSQLTKYVDDDSTADAWHSDSLMIAKMFTVDDTLILDEFEVLLDKKIFQETMIYENFEEISPPNLPSGWFVPEVALGNKWEAVVDSENAYNGTNVIKYSHNDSIAADTWIFTSSLDLIEGVSYQLNLFYKISVPEEAPFFHNFESYLSSSPNPDSIITDKKIFYLENFFNTNYNEISDSFISAATGTYYIGIHCYSNPVTTDLYIDDIEVKTTDIPENINAKFYVYSSITDSTGNILPYEQITEAEYYYTIDTSMTAHYKPFTTRMKFENDDDNDNTIINRNLSFYPGDSFFIIADFAETDPNFKFTIGVDDSDLTSHFLIKNQNTWIQNPGNLIIRTKYITNPIGQDEWIISNKRIVEQGDIINFWLGDCPTWGLNSPVYLLASTNNQASWDTLFNYFYDYQNILDPENNSIIWDYYEYQFSLSEYIGQEIQFAFRYLGIDGELVALDDIYISNGGKEERLFFVTPVKYQQLSLQTRTPQCRKSKSTELSGYELYRKMFHTDNFFQIPAPDTIITDTTFTDTDVCMDTVYIYKVRAIYNGIIPSEYSDLDTGYVYYNSNPGTPNNWQYTANWTTGRITLSWDEPDSLGDDIEYYYFYDNSANYDSVKSDETDFVIWDPNQITVTDHPWATKLYRLTIKAKDFAGDFSAVSNECEILTPPKILLDSEPYSIKITISKWADGEVCQPSDSIRIYRSSSEEDTSSVLIKVLTDPSYFIAGDAVYTDFDVTTDSTYYYYATITYDDNGIFVESLQSVTAEETPLSEVENITDITFTYTDSSIIYQWSEPDTASLNYGGLYIYNTGNFNFPIDTLYYGTTIYEYSEPGIYDFTLWAFDIYGNRGDEDVKNTYENIVVKLDYIPITLDTAQVIIEDFENDSLSLWTWDIVGDSTGIWQVSEDGSSQWFSIPNGDGKYAWINDDALGQTAYTNCYLVFPEIVSLNNSDKVYLMFDSFFDEEFDGTAYVSIKTGDIWTDVVEITEDNNEWGTDAIQNVITISNYIDSTCINSFQVGFHYDDDGTWSEGWAIDNVALLATSEAQVPLVKKFSNDTEFYLYKIYPNPFSEVINFSFKLTESSLVSLEIYNILGQKVATVCNKKELGWGFQNLTWNGSDDNGKKIASGIYLYRIGINNNSKINKLMLIK